ncbi:segregation and condensation protein A [Gluconobacter sphaericus]|uniref:segregation and condensation protein A n=1 Tax=Gluconobacter sphaericus TaxID=574987 RepID=UPI001B8C4A0A|nr:segregation/condensation protein A [Gluconobacter sphaericus]MBS1087294.1 segregation/condensation protein A [Gluconobacter sphaericus]MBS1101304.1 segregation/condensation protein A [Gluconobacter sphaericus]
MSEGALLEVGAWQGPLEALLQAVRRRAIDLRTLPLRELIDQFLICVEEGLKNRPLEQTANDLVLAATLLQMRSALLLREDTEEHLAAHSAAEQLQRALLRKDTLLQVVECFETRPVLGESVFGRGKLPPSPSAAETASLILTRDLLDALLSASRRREKLRPPEKILRPSFIPRVSVQDAIAWWQQKLWQQPECAWDLIEGVMDLSPGEGPQSLTQRKAAWAAHLSAVLELEKRGELYLKQSLALGTFVVAHP